jgi:predicted permease
MVGLAAASSRACRSFLTPRNGISSRWTNVVQEDPAPHAGDDVAALSVISVAMAFTIPTINIINIFVLAAFGKGTATTMGILVNIVKKPLVIACVIGLALNLSGLVLTEQILAPLDLISRGALAVGLLTVVPVSI